jgi:hypothetical protein
MKFDIKTCFRVALMVVLAAAALSCSNEITKSASPVELVVTNTQALQHIDLQPGATNCDKNVGTIDIRAILKNPASGTSQQFNDVRIKSYHVSYVRTDGGSHVPAPFTRSIDLLVPASGASTGLGQFVILQADAITQAPFVSLLPTNGGRDTETGRSTIRMDVVVQVFGETLAGSNVSGTTRFPLDFCYQCSGCS